MGIELILSMAVGYYGGRWLDGKLGTHGWLTWVGFAIGVYAGFRSLFVTARKMQRDVEAEERAERRETPYVPLPPLDDDAGSKESKDSEEKSPDPRDENDRKP